MAKKRKILARKHRLHSSPSRSDSPAHQTDIAVAYREVTTTPAHQTTMATSYREIATTKPFCFIIGSSAIQFFAHPTIIVQQSKPLAKLIHGDMREAQEGQARIEEVDENTFARFLEYCYTKDYPAAEHAIVLDAASIEQERQIETAPEVDMVIGQNEPAQAINGWGYDFRSTSGIVLGNDGWEGRSGWSKAPGKKGPRYRSVSSQPEHTHGPRYTNAWSAVHSMSWTLPSDENKIAADQARSNKEACEDYTDVFLSHAKIYVFADTYGIDSLRVSSLQKLHKTLSLFTLFPKREEDIAALLQYTYENTAEREGKMDDLRELVIKYVCCNVEKLRSSKTFKETLRADNACSMDLIEMLLPRLD